MTITTSSLITTTVCYLVAAFLFFGYDENIFATIMWILATLYGTFCLLSPMILKLLGEDV